MHYKDKSLGFSFDLPEGWCHDKHNLTLTFFGPNGRIGYSFELIQVRLGTILPRYVDPESRERFLNETTHCVRVKCLSPLPSPPSMRPSRLWPLSGPQ
jgi:hypothetical protein